MPTTTVTIPVGEHLVTCIDVRKDISAKDTFAVVFTFEDDKKRRHWEKCWATANAYGRSLRSIRSLGVDVGDELNVAVFRTVLVERPMVGKKFHIRVEKQPDKPTDTQIATIWSATGVSPEEADASELAFAFEQAKALRDARRNGKTE